MNRDSVVVALGLLTVGFGTNVSTPYLVLYRDRLGLSDNATQAIFVVYVAGIVATLLFAGQLSDRFGRRRVMVPSLVLSAVGSLLLILGRDDYGYLLAGRVLLGVVSGASLGVGAAWLQELMGRGNEMRAAIVTTFVTYGGFGIGPPLSAAYEHWAPNPLIVPYLLHIVVALAVVFPLLRVRETVKRTAGRWRPRLVFGVPEGSRRQFGWALAPAALLVFSFPSTGFSLFPVLVSDALDGGEVLVAGAAGALVAWGALLARPFLRRIPAEPALLGGAVIGTTGLVLGTVAYTTDAWPIVWPAALMLGAASGILSTACLTLIGVMTDEANRGALTSTFYLIAYVGMATPLGITAIGDVVGLTAALIGLTVIAAAVTLTTPSRRRIAAV